MATCGFAYDVDTEATIYNASRDFRALYKYLGGWVLVVYVGWTCCGFNKISRNHYLGCLQLCFHWLLKTWNQIEQLTHCERDWAVREGLPYRVCFRYCVLRGCCGCALLPHAFHICVIGLCHLGLRRVAYLVLFFPCGHLGMAACCDLPNLRCDCVYRWEFAFFLIRALRCIVLGFLAIKTMHTRLASFSVDLRDGH